jgi:radical SAM protein (TIGR01212 family)
MTRPFYALSAYFRQRFQTRMQKVPLDAGATCPNRDGTISRHGCAFCNPAGSGTGQGDMPLARQWDRWRRFYQRRHASGVAFMAYLQSYSNTHGPIHRLARLMDEVAALPGCSGAAVGTRPDCLDPERIGLVAGLPFEEVWMELGLQSARDATLARINRGHDAACFARAAEACAGAGLRVCAHLVAGLPGEDGRHLEASVRFVNDLPVAGVKFHNLYLARGAPLASEFAAGTYAPPSREEYVDWLARALGALRPDIVVQRLTGDPAPGELLAPDWAADKNAVIQALEKRMAAGNLWQGRFSGHPAAAVAPPAWFSPRSRPAPQRPKPEDRT